MLAKRAGVRTYKRVVFVLACLPFAYLAVNWGLLLEGMPHRLGFNPIEKTYQELGDWAFRLLIATLCLTPLTRIFKKPVFVAHRRMLGLFTFTYALAHLSSYIAIDQAFDWPAILKDILKRNYITVGMVSFLLLLPLAWTSRDASVRQMGARRWQKLHRLIYVIAPLVALHFFMMRKGVQIEPLVYAGIVLLLLLYRVGSYVRRRLRTKPKKPQRQLKLVIFDCDGVLVDSEALANEVLSDALNRQGIFLTPDDMEATFNGLAPSDILRRIGRLLGRPAPPGFWHDIQVKTFARFHRDLKPIPGALEAVAAVQEMDLLTCIASSGEHEKLRITLPATGLATLFGDQVYSAEDVPLGKPAPDLFLHAAKEMGVRPSECLVIEDSAPGLAAAHAAGMRAVLYAPGNTQSLKDDVVQIKDMAALADLIGTLRSTWV